MFFMELNEAQLNRYSRQMLLSGIGGTGQEKLLKSSVLVAGAGGLGSIVLLYLAGAGVGKIGVIDFDKVEISNLHRQVIHNTNDIGKEKVISVKEKINLLNPDVEVVTFCETLNKTNIELIFNQFDVIVDCLDNFRDKFLINDFSVRNNKKFIHAGVIGFEGQLIAIFPGKSACLRCFLKEEPQDAVNQSCKETGVLGTCACVIGALQANEVLKLLLGIGNLLVNKVLKFNCLSGRFYELAIDGKSKTCPLCSSLVMNNEF